MRSDLRQVEDKASRIFEYADTFDSFDKDWSHLKNNEDYPQDWRLPPDEGRPINAIYANGRQDAINIKNWFWQLNSPEAHPTLKSFVDAILPALEFTLEQATATLESAKKAHSENDERYWSVGEMIKLTQKQVALIKSSIQTVQLLKASKLYREENGEEIMTDDKHIIINTNSYNNNSNSNINSLNASGNTISTTSTLKESALSLWLARNVGKIVIGVLIAVIAAAIIKHFGFQ